MTADGVPIPDFVERTFWLFDGSNGCNLCQDMTGGYHEEPERPHENCKCPLTEGEVRCSEVSREEEVIDQYELLLKIACVSKAGGTEALARTWSTGKTVSGSGTGSAKFGDFGISVGGGVSETTTTGGTDTVTFHYDPEEGGESQWILAEYEVTVHQETITWLAHWTETTGDPNETFETMKRWEERLFIRYRQVPV